MEADADSLKNTYIHLSTEADKRQAGSYSIKVTCDEHPNYVITPENGTYTVRYHAGISSSGTYDGGTCRRMYSCREEAEVPVKRAV